MRSDQLLEKRLVQLTIVFNNLEVSLGFSNFGKSRVMRITEENKSLIGLDFIPQGHTEGIKSLGASLGQQVEEFHVLAETASLGLQE